MRAKIINTFMKIILMFWAFPCGAGFPHSLRCAGAQTIATIPNAKRIKGNILLNFKTKKNKYGAPVIFRQRRLVFFRKKHKTGILKQIKAELSLY